MRDALSLLDQCIEAASISITFMLADAAMARQMRHSPQGPSSPGFSQFTALARIFATVVLPEEAKLLGISFGN